MEAVLKRAVYIFAQNAELVVYLRFYFTCSPNTNLMLRVDPCDPSYTLMERLGIAMEPYAWALATKSVLHKINSFDDVYGEHSNANHFVSCSGQFRCIWWQRVPAHENVLVATSIIQFRAKKMKPVAPKQSSLCIAARFLAHSIIQIDCETCGPR